MFMLPVPAEVKTLWYFVRLVDGVGSSLNVTNSTAHGDVTRCVRAAMIARYSDRSMSDELLEDGDTSACS